MLPVPAAAHPHATLARATAHLASTARPLAGTWWRAVAPAFRTMVSNTRYTRTARSRYSSGGGRFQLLYLAESPVVAEAEYGALLGRIWVPGGWMTNPARVPVTIPVAVSLRRVIDLTDVTAQDALASSAQELTGDWDGYALRGRTGSIAAPTGDAPTQRLGATLDLAGLDGAVTVSARIPYARVLLIFPHNLASPADVLFPNAAGDPTVPISR